MVMRPISIRVACTMRDLSPIRTPHLLSGPIVRTSQTHTHSSPSTHTHTHTTLHKSDNSYTKTGTEREPSTARICTEKKNHTQMQARNTHHPPPSPHNRQPSLTHHPRALSRIHTCLTPTPTLSHNSIHPYPSQGHERKPPHERQR